MKTLFSQALTYIFVSILIVVLLLSSVFFFSIRRSVAVWNVNQGQRLENLLLPLLTQVYRQKGDLTNTTIHQELSPFLTSNVFAYIFSVDREPLYIYSKGGRIPLYDEDKVNASLQRIKDRQRPLSAIIANDTIIGYLAADTVGFAHDVANRRFLQSVFTFLGWGTGISIIVAAVSALIFSKIFSKQARSLANGLEKLTKGERGVKFPLARAEEMRAIAESARHLQKKLKQEENLRRQWAEDVAHDLRTPVSALKVQFEGLTDGVFEPTRERLESLFTEVCRIESLVNDLQELNKMESPEMQIEKEKIGVKQLVDKIIFLFTSSYQSNQKFFSVDCSVDSCWADRHYLHRALTNVINNAVRHVVPDGTIEVRIYREGDIVVFDISNTGTVNPDNLERFFDRLYRGSTSRSESGSGLGLPITRAITRLHGGDAWMKQINDRTHVYLTIHDRPQQFPPQTGTQNHG